MRNASKHRLPVVVACLVASALMSIARADTITLKTAARQRSESAVITLGDVAVLTGEEALRLAGVQVASVKSGSKPVEIVVADIRRALDAAGVNWAKVNLSGRSVLVRPARGVDSLPPQAMSAVAIDKFDASKPSAPKPTVEEEPSVTLDTIVSEPSIRGSIAKLFITNLRADPREVRVRSNAEDATLLNTALATGRFEIQPLGSLAGDRLVFAIRAWNGNAIESRGQSTLTVERLMQVTRCQRDLSRSSAVNDEDIETAAVWLAPSEAVQAAARAVIVGRNVTRAMNAGEMIRARDVERETLIKRGDLVTIRCLVGGVAIALQAEARGDGSLGDTIEFRKNGERESFLATITGKSEAVVDLGKK